MCTASRVMTLMIPEQDVQQEGTLTSVHDNYAVGMK